MVIRRGCSMFNIFIQVITYVLALYGLSIIIFNILYALIKKPNIREPHVKLVLIVKNQEDIIEGIIRNIFMVDFLKKIIEKEKLTIIDMGSTDDTFKIITRLRKDNKGIEILEYNQKEKIFAGYETNSSTYIAEANE